MGSDGSISRVFGTFQDVTDNIKEREAFDRTRTAYDSLINSTSDGCWDWHISDDYEYMSPRFWEMFGYSPDEKVHKPSAWHDMIFEEDLQTLNGSFKNHVKTHGQHPYRHEARFRHKDGSTVTVLRRGRVIEWDGDKPIRMIGTHTDISELKRAEEELRANLEFQHLLINTDTDLVFVKDAEFKIVQANDAFVASYPGKERKDILGTTTVEEFDPVEAQLFLAEDRKAFEQGLSEVVETIVFPGGEERTLLTKKMRFDDPSGNPHILGVARDITGLRKTEKALLKANEELKEFAYRTSHDLRSPLVSSRRLLGIVLKLLAKEKNSEIEKVISHLDLIDGSLEKLETLVTDILAMTRLSHDECTPEPIDFPVLVNTSPEKFSHMEGFSRIALTTDYSKLPEKVESSLAHVSHVVENLISNAIKYQDYEKSEPKVSITASGDGNNLNFSVADNGLGIPANQRENVFSMFKRFHPKTSFGSGLGLYMIKKSIEKLHGSIRYEPLEAGSRFVVCIPVKSQISPH